MKDVLPAIEHEKPTESDQSCEPKLEDTVLIEQVIYTVFMFPLNSLKPGYSIRGSIP